MFYDKCIGVIGQGFVGGSLTTVFAERGIGVYAYDKSGKYVLGALESSEKGFPKSTSELVLSTEGGNKFTNIYFVCLPTPMKKDGSADLSIVEGELQIMSEIPGEKIAVIKSTVPPGTTEIWNKRFQNTDLKIVFCPEFLTEANALEDMRNQDRIIVGGDRKYTKKVRELFQYAFPDVPIHETSSTNAELVKYFQNIHLAVKVSLANEFYQLSNALIESGFDADYNKAIELAKLDKRLGTSHWQVPGPMPADDTGLPAFGWAGSCFIKDINALMYQCKQLGVDPKVMSGAWEKNLEVRPQRDWEKLKGRAVSEEK